jgi:hypothetical protein
MFSATSSGGQRQALSTTVEQGGSITLTVDRETYEMLRAIEWQRDLERLRERTNRKRDLERLERIYHREPKFRPFFPPCAVADAPELPPPAPFLPRRSPRRRRAARRYLPVRSRPGRKRARAW